MKYRKNGRVYRLVKGYGCEPCAFYEEQKTDSCPYAKKKTHACFTASMNPTVWRETLFSKIRNWRRKG